MTERFTIDVVIPVLNEERIVSESIQRAIAALESVPEADYNVIIVDDGSTDRTWEIVCSATRIHPRVRGVRLSRNFGHDAAVFTGFLHSTSDATITMDCDGQHPFDLIPRLISVWRETGCEVVNAVKSKRGEEASYYALAVRLCSGMLSRIMNVDLQNATEFKLIERKAREALLQCGDHHFFYRALVPWIGFRQTTLPFETGKGMRDGSHWTLRSLVGFAVSGMIMFTDFPLRFMLYVGLFVILLCAGLLTKLVVTYFTEGVAEGYSTLLAFALLNSGIIITGIGVIGIYLRATLNQTTGRPRAIVRETTEGDGALSAKGVYL